MAAPGDSFLVISTAEYMAEVTDTLEAIDELIAVLSARREILLKRRAKAGAPVP